MKNKIIDCVTFFNENYIFELRYNILKDFIDYFVICESKYDHKGNPKKINFICKEDFDKNKIKHIILEDPFPQNTNAWENQAIQREFILKNLNFAGSEDYIFFSDPDEIPNPKILENFELKKKYGILMQTSFAFKFNIYNKAESPWEGSRVCKKKNLDSIDFMRQKIKKKNLDYKFWRFDKEKSIQIYENAGWHFNNILTPKEISIKLKTFAHEEFSQDKFSSEEVIKEKIKKKVDLFGRGHKYETIDIDDKFPKYLIKNKKKFENFIDN